MKFLAFAIPVIILLMIISVIDAYTRWESPTPSGAKLYVLDCTQCHNTDPSLPGDIGPEIAWSSEGLLTARLRYGGYPVGYVPKRCTRIMPMFRQLTDEDIHQLYLFLNKR